MSSNLRYIGNYDINAEGKFLWEILCQLRNLGRGRIVTKNEWIRKWPKQPSYLKIVKVRTEMVSTYGVPFSLNLFLSTLLPVNGEVCCGLRKLFLPDCVC